MSKVKTTALFIVRLFGFRRRKPTTRLGRYARNSERAVGITALIYLSLLCFPQALFAHSVTARGVKVYSRTPLPPETTTRIEEAVALVRQSELAVPDRTERIFVCDDAWLFRLFSPLSPNSFANSWPFTDNIFVASADIARNVSRSSAPAYNRRSFSRVVAHEIIHGLIRHRVGVLPAMRLRGWIAEGYCDYVAQESSFPEADGLMRLRDGKDDASASFQYFVYRQMVRHLIEDRHYSFDEIAKRAGDEEAIKAETIAATKEASSR